MFALCGIAGLYVLQAAGNRRAQQHAAGHSKPAVAGQLKPTQCLDSTPCSPAKQRPQNLSHIIKHGAVVCFKDKRGQTAVVQPFGTGNRTWQLAVTCASGGVCKLSQGVSMSFVAADALFLVVQVDKTSTFALRSLGAEGRYLAAHRDLAQPPIIEAHRITPAAQWKITSSGLTNLQHGHKKLGYTVHEVKAVPLDAIAAVEHSYDAQLARQWDQTSAAEACSRSLDRQLQEVTSQLVAARQEHVDTVELLTKRLVEAQQHLRLLESDARQRNEALLDLEQCVEQLTDACKSGEAELKAAHREIEILQDQVAELQQAAQQEREVLQQAMARDVAKHEASLAGLQEQHSDQLEQLEQQHERAARQWGEVRSVLESNLLHKDANIAQLSEHVQRLNHALQEVNRLMCGNTRRQRVDRASLDAVSIHQLQAAVAQFAAVGSPECDSVGGESEALRTLLASQISDSSQVSGEELEEQQQHASFSSSRGYGSSHDTRDLGISADQSPGRAKQDSPLSSVAAGALSARSHMHQHDSPLLKLAASGALRGSASQRQQQQRITPGSSPASSRLGGGLLGPTAASQGSRAGGSVAAGAAAAAGKVVAASSGASWLAAAAAASSGKDAGASSWPKAGAPAGRHHLHSTSATSSRTGAGACAAGSDELPSWGMSDVAVSGSSRRAASSAASDEHGTHRYSCSDVSDGSSQPCDEDYQADLLAGCGEELDVIDTGSAAQSLEEAQLRQHIRLSQQQHDGSSGGGSPVSSAAAAAAVLSRQQQQQQQGPGGAVRAAGGPGRLSLSGGGIVRRSSSSLTPVKEEQQDEQAVGSQAPGLTMANLRERMNHQGKGSRVGGASNKAPRQQQGQTNAVSA